MTPLSDEVRAQLKLLGPEPDPKRKSAPYNSRGSQDAAPFDSVPGIGFDSNPNAAAILPPTGRLTGSGPDLSVAAAQNNAFRAINSAWRQGATVQLTTGSESRYFISGLSESAQAELVSSLALIAERAERRGARRAGNCATEPSPARASASSGPGARAWTKGGLDGCSNSMDLRSLCSGQPIFARRFAKKSTSSS